MSPISQYSSEASDKVFMPFLFHAHQLRWFSQSFLSRDMAYKLKELINNMSPEEYYNIACQSCNK